MQSSSQTQRKLLQEDVIRTKGALSDLEREKLLTGMLLKESKDKLSYSQDILDGHYKFTFLIQGDPQTGKTTFLNVLFDDAIIPSSGYNAIIVVQYDETLAIPALFTAPLNDIFNSERQVFVINPEILRDTGIRESAKIYSTLKEATKTVNPRLGQTVYVIKHRIPWLKKLIGDQFILNRIQFVEINMPPENDPNPENLLRLEKIISSTDHANIFVADGTKLFSIDTAAKYKELSNNKENKEKSLLIINRTDQLGTREHIQKIRQNEPRLCLKLQKEIQTIMKIIKDAGDTEEMRCEIFLQSFYENQRIDQDKLIDGDVIYFVSALFAFNKILLSRYEKCEYDGEKFALCSLFNERNEDNPVYQSNKTEADLQELDVLEYHIREEPDLYESNFEPIKNAISKIAKTKFAALEDTLIKKVEETRLKISDCRSYLTDDLSEQIEDLKTLGGEIKTMIEERSTTFQELVNNFKEKVIVLFEEFRKGIKDINKDFYVVKANHANELTNKTKQFEERSNQITDKFKQDYTDMETRYKKKIDDLDNANKDKKSLNYYIANNVRSEFRALEKRSGSLVNLVEGFAICTTNRIIRFVNDGKGFNIFTNLLRILAQLFGNENTFDSFEETVEKSKSIFNSNTKNLMNSHCVKEKKKKKKFEEHFTDYLSNMTSGNIERAQKIIHEHFKPLKI